MKFFLVNKNGYLPILSSLAILLYEQFIDLRHTDHFTPQHTAFEQAAACLSFVFESIPGSILFAILWHAG